MQCGNVPWNRESLVQDFIGTIEGFESGALVNDENVERRKGQYCARDGRFAYFLYDRL